MAETTSNINLKTGTLITAVAVVVFALASWALSELYGNITGQVKVQWQKLDKMEKAICSQHPQICKDL